MIAKELEYASQPGAQVTCVLFKHSRVDNHRILRIFDYERRCHLCHDSLAEFMPADMNAMDDVTDHDLFHC